MCSRHTKDTGDELPLRYCSSGGIVIDTCAPAELSTETNSPKMISFFEHVRRRDVEPHSEEACLVLAAMVAMGNSRVKVSDSVTSVATYAVQPVPLISHRLGERIQLRLMYPHRGRQDPREDMRILTKVLLSFLLGSRANRYFKVNEGDSHPVQVHRKKLAHIPRKTKNGCVSPTLLHSPGMCRSQLLKKDVTDHHRELVADGS